MCAILTDRQHVRLMLSSGAKLYINSHCNSKYSNTILGHLKKRHLKAIYEELLASFQIVFYKFNNLILPPLPSALPK